MAEQDNIAMNNEEPSLLDQVVQRIQNFLESVRAEEQQVDRDMAQHLLEMANGNLDVAESLYYDDYFANLEQQGRGNNNNRRAAAAEADSPRRVRRRLERELEQANYNQNNQDDDDESVESINQEEEENEDQGHDDNDNELALPVRDDASSSSSDDESESSNNDNHDDDDENNNGEAGAAVSDDEGPRARRRPRRRRIRIHQDNDNNNDGPLLRNISIEASAGPEQDAGPPPPYFNPGQQVFVKTEEKHQDDDDDDIGDDFFSDFDYIFQDGSSTTSSSKPPVLLLWGDLVAKHKAEYDSNNEASNNALPQGSNVVAQDEDDDDDEDEGGTPKPEIPKEGIPKTWLRAGFKPSKCGTGLITEPPDEKETSLSRWRQSGSRNIAPPPYHCLGVTALLSVVTALMYSGASIQGSEVNCNAARTPLADLPEQDRKHEFDGRLIDALSALVWIAAQASLERKKRALAKRKLVSSNSDEEKSRQQAIQRKLQLIPTCRFDKDSGTGDGKIVEGRQVKIATSLTRMEDIRAYVVSTLRSFTKKGGCALFLETIICIHGETCVERMVRNARRKAGLEAKDVLIECHCEARQKKLSQASSPTFGASITTEPREEPVPLDHTCISTELISLLLTGEVRATLQNWSTGSLNIGVLSGSAEHVDGRLLRPEKPVWIIQGDTCYSVAWLDGNKEHYKAVCRGDCAGTLTHWNPWFGHRHKSTMRLLAARGEWKPPVLSKQNSAESEKKTVTASILARRKEQLSHVVSSDEQENVAATRITREEIDQVQINPEDEELYPGNYRQWRFHMGRPPAVKTEEDVKVGLASSSYEKEHVHWIPYFRLNEHQQQVVAMKVSPAIKRILWTRWPGATIDRFSPEDDETPPAV